MTKRERNKLYKSILEGNNFTSESDIFLCNKFKRQVSVRDNNELLEKLPEFNQLLPKNYTPYRNNNSSWVSMSLNEGIYYKKSSAYTLSARRVNQIRATMLEFAIEMSK